MHIIISLSSNKLFVLAVSSNDTFSTNENIDYRGKIIRILHVVTSLHEYDSGKRYTTKSQDRLFNSMVPTLVKTISSLLSSWDDENLSRRYLIDVYLILGYKLPLGSNRYEQLVGNITSIPHFIESGLDIFVV